MICKIRTSYFVELMRKMSLFLACYKILILLSLHQNFRVIHVRNIKFLFYSRNFLIYIVIYSIRLYRSLHNMVYIVRIRCDYVSRNPFSDRVTRLHKRSVPCTIQKQICNEITSSIAKPRDLGIRPSHERFRCMFPARAIYLHLCGNKDHGRSIKWLIKIMDGNREAHKAKYRSDRSIMLRTIDLDPIRFDLFSHFIVLHACLPVDENGLQELQRTISENGIRCHKAYSEIITSRKLRLPR